LPVCRRHDRDHFGRNLPVRISIERRADSLTRSDSLYIGLVNIDLDLV
jgi:hypothetical protein